MAFSKLSKNHFTFAGIPLPLKKYPMNSALQLESALGLALEVPLVHWNTTTYHQAGLEVWVLREDLLHPWIQGNKWHKLNFFLMKAIEEKKSGLVSVGGAFSNHLIACAAACHILGLECILYVRGSEKEWDGNAAIAQLRAWNATLIPVERGAFRNLYSGESTASKMALLHPHFQYVPMGGSHENSVASVARWAQSILTKINADIVVLPVATGGTLAGFSIGLSPPTELFAVEVLKGEQYLKTEWNALTKGNTALKPVWLSNYHFGGYARSTPELRAFCSGFFAENGFHIEPTYSGKACWATLDLAKKGHFPDGSRILIVHTGGIFPWTIQ